MRPFWPLAALCLLLHLTTACKEIKLKFDLQRMVERELNKIPNNLSWSCLVFRHGEEDLCRHPAHHKGDGNQHHPRAWREGESGFYSYSELWILPQKGSLTRGWAWSNWCIGRGLDLILHWSGTVHRIRSVYEDQPTKFLFKSALSDVLYPSLIIFTERFYMFLAWYLRCMDLIWGAFERSVTFFESGARRECIGPIWFQEMERATKACNHPDSRIRIKMQNAPLAIKK